MIQYKLYSMDAIDCMISYIMLLSSFMYILFLLPGNFCLHGNNVEGATTQPLYYIYYTYMYMYIHVCIVYMCPFIIEWYSSNSTITCIVT